jgi:hypothetical protein
MKQSVYNIPNQAALTAINCNFFAMQRRCKGIAFDVDRQSVPIPRAGQ